MHYTLSMYFPVYHHFSIIKYDKKTDMVKIKTVMIGLTLYLIETPFNAFANRADTD